METLICSAYGHCFVGAWTEPKKWQLGGGGGNCYQANYYHHHYYCCAQGWKDYTRGWMDSGLGARVLSPSPSHPLPISSSSPSSFTISGVGGTALVGIFNNNNTNNNNNNNYNNSNNKGNVDALVFHNLLEMIPLVESLMDQRGLYNRSFPRHASLVYTHTPTKDRSLNKPLENGSKGWLGRSTSGGKLRPGELLFWDEDADPDEGRDEDMPMLSLSTEHQGTEGYVKQPEFWIEGEDTKKYKSAEEETMPALSSPTTMTEDEASQVELANKEELMELESQVKELERKIEEREKQLQSKVSVQEIHELQALAHRLGKELSKKDHEIQDLNHGLLTKQNELGDLHTHLQKVEAKAMKASKKASEAEQEMLGLRCQVTALLFQLELILHTYAVSEFRGNLSMASTITKGDREEKEPRSKTNGEVEDEEIENARRMYMAAVIAAEKNPEGELLTLVAVSRAQLHSFLV